jgi:hypothetical protein
LDAVLVVKSEARIQGECLALSCRNKSASCKAKVAGIGAAIKGIKNDQKSTGYGPFGASHHEFKFNNQLSCKSKVLCSGFIFPGKKGGNDEEIS